jgi:hypothetical protein
MADTLRNKNEKLLGNTQSIYKNKKERKQMKGTNEYFGDENELQEEREEQKLKYEDGLYDYFKNYDKTD